MSMTKHKLPQKPRQGRAAALMRRSRTQHLIYMTDLDRDPDPVTTVTTLPPGSHVIWRSGAGAALPLARRLRAIARKNRLRFLVAGDHRLARMLKADGLHLKDHPWRRSASPLPLVTAAVHSVRSLYRARAWGVPFVLISPVFNTASGGGKKGMGIHRLARLAPLVDRPVVLGGITFRTAGRLNDIGVYGVAAISGIIPKP